MSAEVTIRNRQRVRVVSVTRLRKLTETLLGECLNILEGELSVVLLSARDMAALNEKFLQHSGSTDVITFSYADDVADVKNRVLQGEIFVCVAEAVMHARRFRTTWQAEVVRYVVHGVLHLLGYEDGRPTERGRMKREENRLVSELKRHGSFRNLGRRPAGRNPRP